MGKRKRTLTQGQFEFLSWVETFVFIIVISLMNEHGGLPTGAALFCIIGHAVTSPVAPS